MVRLLEANMPDPFNAAVAGTRMPLVIADAKQADVPIVYANDSFCSMTGYDRAEIVGRNCRFLQGPDTDPTTVAAIREAIASGSRFETDILNYRKDGQPFWNRLLVVPIRSDGGELTHFFASQIDVSAVHDYAVPIEDMPAAPLVELGHALKVQKESEQRLRFAANAGRMGVWEYDFGSGELSSSPMCRANFGWPEDEHFGFDDLMSCIATDDRALFRSSIEAAHSDGADLDIEVRIKRRNDIGWIQARGQVMDDGTGIPARLAGVTLDVSTRRHAETHSRALAELGDRIRDIVCPRELGYAAAEIMGRALAISRVGYGVVDVRAETITVERDWNAPGVASFAGVLHFRDYGSYIDDLVRGETVVFGDVAHDPRTSANVDALEGRDARSFVNVPVMEYGVLVAVLYLTNAAVRMWTPSELELVKDMAERTRVAIARLTAEDELKRLAASLEQQVEERTASQLAAEDQLRQSQKMEAIGQLTGGVAHDFNNLLTVIRGSVDMLRRPEMTDEKRTRYIDAIGETSDRAARLTGQLLAFARRQALTPERFDVGASLREVLGMVTTLTGSRIVVDLDLPDAPCFIVADRSQFDTSIVNMAVNARDAMDGEGSIRIRVCPSTGIPAIRNHLPVAGDFIAVSLSDTGDGIAADTLERIFEPFFTTKAVGTGTGLGLSQVIGFSKQSGGDVHVESEQGKGTVFTLYLPRAQAPRHRDEAEVVRDQHPSGDGLCVLIVEDNVDVGEFARAALREMGYGTVLAANGLEALERLAEGSDRFNIVFSDVVMPGMSGLELAETVKRLYADLPIVLASGYSHVLAQNGNHGFELLHKPYSIDQLSRIIRKAARTPQGS